MAAALIDGKKVADSIKLQLKQIIEGKQAQGMTPPGLAVVLVGEDPASKVYTNSKKKACEEVGIISHSFFLDAKVTEQQLVDLIQELNDDDQINGILVQLPLPKSIQTERIIETISPQKDVDGFHPYNLGRLAQRHPTLRCCTPFGIIKLFEHYQLPLTGKRAIVVGASSIVGRPLGMELLLAGATVTICNSQTVNLEEIIRFGDIIIAATGIMDLVDAKWLSEKHWVIDVGIHRLANGKLRGDIDFDKAKDRVSWITPVPGGVGPMTIATLLCNTVQAKYGV